MAFKFDQVEVVPELFPCKSGGTSLHLITMFNIHVSLFFEEYPQTLLELYMQCQRKALVTLAGKTNN